MATNQQQQIQFADYEKDFDARQFFKFQYNPNHIRAQEGFIAQLVNHLYSIYDTEILPDNFGKSALDFGCGPSIIGPLCASRKISNIVCADLVDGCHNEIVKWLNNDAESIDWAPFIKHLSEKEGISQDELAKRTRSSIKQVINCDAREDKPLGECPPMAPYDVIMAIFAIQTACPLKEMFIRAIRNLCFYMKPEGLFIMAGILNSGFYSFGHPQRTFEQIYHKDKDVEELLKAADMTVISFSVLKGKACSEDRPDVMDRTLEFYIATAKKNGD